MYGFIQRLNIRNRSAQKLFSLMQSHLSIFALNNYFSDRCQEIFPLCFLLVVLHFEVFCTAKETINRVKWQHNVWEKIFANNTSDKKLIPKVYKELNTIARKQITQLKNGPKIWIDIFQQETYKWPTGIWKLFSDHQGIGNQNHSLGHLDGSVG